MSNSAKLSARERIESLVDANSFVEIGGMITKRNTDFNMQEKAVPAAIYPPQFWRCRSWLRDPNS